MLLHAKYSYSNPHSSLRFIVPRKFFLVAFFSLCNFYRLTYANILFFLLNLLLYSDREATFNKMMMNNDTASEMCANNFTYDKLLHISNIVWYVFGFIGVIVGIPGHILLIIISSNKTSRKEPTSVYFIVIAIVELVFLIGLYEFYIFAYENIYANQ